MDHREDMDDIVRLSYCAHVKNFMILPCQREYYASRIERYMPHAHLINHVPVASDPSFSANPYYVLDMLEEFAV
jgi:hypothetical protein